MKEIKKKKVDRYSMFIDRKTQHIYMLVLPNLIYRFSEISTQSNPNKLLCVYQQRGRRPRIVNIILKKSKVRGLTLPDFKTHCKDKISKTVR